MVNQIERSIFGISAFPAKFDDTYASFGGPRPTTWGSIGHLCATWSWDWAQVEGKHLRRCTRGGWCLTTPRAGEGLGILNRWAIKLGVYVCKSCFMYVYRSGVRLERRKVDRLERRKVDRLERRKVTYTYIQVDCLERLFIYLFYLFIYTCIWHMTSMWLVFLVEISIVRWVYEQLLTGGASHWRPPVSPEIWPRPATQWVAKSCWSKALLGWLKFHEHPMSNPVWVG